MKRILKRLKNIAKLTTEEAISRNIGQMNEEYKNLTRDEKRVLIVQDAKDSYASGFYKMRRRTIYLPTKLLDGSSGAYRFKSSNIQGDLIRGEVENCSVCMKGGLILSKCKLGNDLDFKINELDRTIFGHNPLPEEFTNNEWLNVELLFENTWFGLSTKQTFNVLLTCVEQGLEINYNRLKDIHREMLLNRTLND